MKDQAASTLFRLPGELRHEIYKHSLTSPSPIIDPCVPSRIGPTIRSHRHYTPPLAVALLRTCRRILHEAPAELLYTENHFRFTTSTHAHRFFRSLAPKQAALIHNVELDLFFQQIDTTVRREWSRYLAWAPDCGVWARKVGSLRIDAPRLKTLHLDIGKDVPWLFFEGLLNGPEGLDRIVVSGGRSSGAMAAWELSQPINFPGKPYAEPHVISIMAQCVAGEKDQKVVAWEKTDKRITLQVIKVGALPKTERESSLAVFKCGEKLPPTGLCPLREYEIREEWVIGSPKISPTVF